VQGFVAIEYTIGEDNTLMMAQDEFPTRIDILLTIILLSPASRTFKYDHMAFFSLDVLFKGFLARLTEKDQPMGKRWFHGSKGACRRR
jgi:hypothetical protein